MRGRRFGNTVRYHLWSDARGIWIYYLIIVLVSVTLGILTRRYGGRWGGMETASVIYLLVCGLGAFRERFYLFLQHGFSRRTLVGSFCVSALIFCLGMALADSLLWLLNNQWAPVTSLFQQVYAARDYQVRFLTFALTVVWNFSLYLFFYLLGYFIACLYYRMNKAAKLAVSIGVPALVLLGLPALDGLTGGLVSRRVEAFFLWAVYGPKGFCPWCGVRSFLLGAAVLAALSFLLARRASVRREA